MEAKLVLLNFEVDLLITDIEMPEENGLQLAEWARQEFPEIEIIFLTSHPDFHYAREGVRVGIFEYVLQPVRYRELEQVIARAADKIQNRHSMALMKKRMAYVEEHNYALYDSFLMKFFQGSRTEAGRMWDELRELWQAEGKESRPFLLYIGLREQRKGKGEQDSLLRFVFSNVIAEFFGVPDGQVIVSGIRENEYWCFCFLKERYPEPEALKRQVERIFQFFLEKLHTEIQMIYCDDRSRDILWQLTQLRKQYEAVRDRRSQITVIEEAHPEGTNSAVGDVTAESMDQAIRYIRENLHRKITRGEIAEYVHLNPDYLSRAFKEYTGVPLKDYILQEKMREAERLLVRSSISVAMVAARVGMDNFSYFTLTFKRFYGETPSQYRKDKQK